MNLSITRHTSIFAVLSAVMLQGVVQSTAAQVEDAAQPSFSLDADSPTLEAISATPADVLVPTPPAPGPGPGLPAPTVAIDFPAIPDGPEFDVDAISYGRSASQFVDLEEFLFSQEYFFSVDRGATGNAPPDFEPGVEVSNDVAVEAVRATGAEAAADIFKASSFIDLIENGDGFIGNKQVFDGDGTVDAGTTPGPTPGLGLIEPEDGEGAGDNIDALDLRAPPQALTPETPLFFSIAGDAENMGFGGFIAGLGGPTFEESFLYADAIQLGLTDSLDEDGGDPNDIDALVVFDDGVLCDADLECEEDFFGFPFFDPEADLVLFSLSADSPLIGEMLPALFGELPLEPGDVLVRLPFDEFPFILHPAELMGLCTQRDFFFDPCVDSEGMGISDDLNALDVASAVPEPTTLLLLGLGLAGLGFARKRLH